MLLDVPENDFFSADDLESVDVRPGEVQVRFRGLRQPITLRPAAEGLPWSPAALETAWRFLAPRAGVALDDDDAFAEFVEALEEFAAAALYETEADD